MSQYYEFKCTNPKCGRIAMRYSNSRRCRYCAMLIERIKQPTADEIIAKLRSRVSRLEEAGDKAMGDENWIRTNDGVMYCGFCQKSVSNEYNPKCKHAPDCPVTLWNQAKEGE